MPTVPVADVLVEVLNGTGAKGEAATVGQQLSAAGFDVNGTGDAASFDHVESIVAYSAGNYAAAETVANYVEGAVTFQEIPGLATNEVDLVVGSDCTGIRS